MSSAQAICYNTAPVALTGTQPDGGGGIGSFTFNWESSPTGAPTDFANASGNRVLPGYTPGVLTATTWYRRTVVSGGCTDISPAIQITVNPLPATVTVTGGGSVCINTTLNASNGGDGTMYFQGTTSGGTSTATPSASQPISVPGTYYFRAQSTEGCWSPEGSAAVIINTPPVTTGAIICQGGSGTMSSSTVCGSGSPTPVGPRNAGNGRQSNRSRNSCLGYSRKRYNRRHTLYASYYYF